MRLIARGNILMSNGAARIALFGLAMRAIQYAGEQTVRAAVLKALTSFKTAAGRIPA